MGLWPQTAPDAIQSARICFSSSESGFLGGISSLETFSHKMLSSSLPGVIGGPLSPPTRAASEYVKSSPPFLSEVL